MESNVTSKSYGDSGHVAEGAATSRPSEHAQKCLDSTNEGTHHVRSLYLTLLVTGGYLGVIIAGTTDEQLLRDSPVTLPLLNVSVPIKRFYEFVPWAFVLLHFNLLLQFALLAEKVRVVNKFLERVSAGKQSMLREQLFTFPFLYMLIQDHEDQLLRAFMTLMVSVTVIALPLALLLWAQMAFLPYNEPGVTWGHRAAIVVDIYFLIIFWPRIVSTDGAPQGAARWWLKWFNMRLHLVRGCVTRFLEWIFTLLRLVVSRQWQTQCPTTPGLQSLEERGRGTLFLLMIAIATLIVSTTIVTLPDNPTDAKRKFPDSKLDFIENPLTSNELSARTINTLREGGAQSRDEALEYALGISLKGRTLRYATLSQAILPKADLSGSDLREADLKGAQLQGANLERAQLQSANLQHAQLHGAKLFGAMLQGASLRKAELQGANLRSAMLAGAEIVNAKLQGALLLGAQLQGADLQGAQLQGADLSLVDLRGANLVGANLRGADLRAALIGGADFQDAILDQVDLREVDREPLTQVQYELLAPDLEKGILNPIYRESVLESVEKDIQQPAIFNMTKINFGLCISEFSEDHLNCAIVQKPLRSRDEPVYSGHRLYLAKYLAELSCHDPDVARQVVQRITRENEPKFARDFTTRAAKCPIIEKLPEDVSKKLKDLADRAGQDL